MALGKLLEIMENYEILDCTLSSHATVAGTVHALVGRALATACFLSVREE